MGKIVLLDDLTINQIAAGEVIERPASVIKELVENSIDAGAKNITVDIKNGGISYIRITDDGSGIMPDDMEIAFERHATSKIRKAEDLDEVKSMGFRGEALASIGAIAKIEMVSKTADQDLGYKIYVDGGKISDKHEEGASKGTTITVKELFFNTPVRYKFLRKDFTESGYIEDVVTRIALANPSVAIKLINTGKTVIQTNGSGKLEDVIYAIYGKEVYENILPVDYTYEDMHVTGVIGKPLISRSNRSNQLFFVNNRFIKDKTLTSAAEQGFKGLVTIGKHGFLILNIEMDPKKVDVNVHPTKLEVRFQEDSKVFKAVFHAIKETLLKGDLVSDTEKDYSDMTPNDMLKEVKNKDRVEAWGLNKKSDSNVITESTIMPKQETKINALDSLKTTDTEKSNLDITPKPEFKEFKNTISGLDEVTRKRFISEIAKAKTSEEIVKGLNSFTSLLQQKNAEETNKKEETKIDNTSEKDEKVSDSTNQEIGTEKQEENTTTSLDLLKEINDYNTKDLENFKAKDEEPTENSIEEKLEEVTEIPVEESNEETVEEKTEEPTVNPVEEKIIEEPTEKQDEEKIEESTEEPVAEKVEEPILESIEKPAEEKIEEPVAEPQKSQVAQLIEQEQNQEISFEEMYKKLFGRDIEDAKKQYKQQVGENETTYPISPITDNEISMFENVGTDKNPPYKFIGIAFNTYIILTMNSELYILDQHAAHERIMYEKVKANYYTEGVKDSQLMLLPDIINLNNKEMGIFKDNKDLFTKAGFVVDEFGDNTVKLTGVPEFCLDFDTKEIFLETLDEINTVARTAKQELENKFLATVACKAAVKAHMALTKEEVDSLMSQLLKLPNPFSCPHGRPTVIKMSKTDIEKKFSRR